MDKYYNQVNKQEIQDNMYKIFTYETAITLHCEWSNFYVILIPEMMAHGLIKPFTMYKKQLA